MTSVLYLVAFIYLFAGAYRYQKSKERLYAIAWIGNILVLITCYHVAVAGVIGILHIPVDLISISVADILIGSLIWYRNIKTKNYQKYQWSVVDIVFIVAISVIAGAVWKIKFGGTGFNISFATIDPVQHLKAAMDVAVNAKVQNMYYSALENGLLIKLFMPIFKAENSYKIFILCEIYHFILAALVFYGYIRKYMKDRMLVVAGFLLTMLYAVGYPLNCLFYGFVYLGLGVTVINVIISLADSYIRKEFIDRRVAVVLLALCCYGIFQCYVLFMPVTYFALITAVFVDQYRRKELVSVNTVKICLGIFLVPCILGFYYTYAGIFAGTGNTVANQISLEGACYRDLYSNFLPVLPFALLGLYKGIKDRKNKMLYYITIYALIFVGALFVIGMLGKASSYYYYKNYNILWMLIFTLAMQGIARIDIKDRAIVVCYGIVVALPILSLFGDVEAKIGNRNELFAPCNKSYQLNDLYCYNKHLLREGGYSQAKLELYKYVYNNYVEKEALTVPIVSFWEDAYWFEAVSGQRLSDKYDFAAVEDSKNIKWMKDNAKYIVVLKSAELYEKNKEYYDSLERSYENEEGFVAVLD